MFSDDSFNYLFIRCTCLTSMSITNVNILKVAGVHNTPLPIAHDCFILGFSYISSLKVFNNSIKYLCVLGWSGAFLWRLEPLFSIGIHWAAATRSQRPFNQDTGHQFFFCDVKSGSSYDKEEYFVQLTDQFSLRTAWQNIIIPILKWF